MLAISCSLAALGVLLAVLVNSASALSQTIQNGGVYPDGTPRLYWQPTNDPRSRQEVYTNLPTYVVLEYNCALMKNICLNAYTYFTSPRGQQGAEFAMDLSGKRARARRNQACPTGWAQGICYNNVGQFRPFRQDGQWWTIDTNPGGVVLQTTPHGQRSYIYYTCDEFPAASWIQGGRGSVGNAEQRCAGQRCPKTAGLGIKAEQDWQAEAHRKLGDTLRSLLLFNPKVTAPNPSSSSFKNVAIFHWRSTFDPTSGIAAKVMKYNSLTATAPYRTLIVNQQKRSMTLAEEYAWFKTASSKEHQEYFGSPIYQHAVVAKGHYVPTDDPIQDPFAYLHDIFMGNTTHPVSPANHSSEASHHKKDQQPAPQIHPKIRHAPLLTNATAEDIERARILVDEALERSETLNAARMANPRRNNYHLRPGTTVAGKAAAAAAPPPHNSTANAIPRLEITKELDQASALLAAVGMYRNNTALASRAAGTGTFWMESIDRKGTVPWGDDPSYKVFRNVRDYGAVGDGSADDTEAIEKAMMDGKRCGEKCNGSTRKNAIVYFPPGRYKIRRRIEMPFGTQVIGDANNWPTLVATPFFLGAAVLSTDKYTGDGKGADGLDDEWFINTANFYRQIRNIRIDVTATRPAQGVACIHYQVAQATSIQNVELIAKSGTKQLGIMAENGSGGVISDVIFTGGAFGIYGGNQQFTAQRLTFNGCDVGVQVIWDWGWVWKSITMKNVGIGFKLLQETKKPSKRAGSAADSNGNIGSISVIDSEFESVQTAILIAPISAEAGSGSTGIIIEHTKFNGVGKAVADSSGAVLFAGSSVVNHWALGPVYSKDGKRMFSRGEKVGDFERTATLLDQNDNYFERPKPQYQELGASSFVHVKDFGAKGDGASDDTASFQVALDASQGKVLFVDAGSYLIKNTLHVPPGARIVGEAWSQIVATGPAFQDASSPRVMFQVGRPGDVGSVEMQDLIFTSRGSTPGLVVIEWNIQANLPGAAALWDCHIRLGGATGTELTPAECPPSIAGIDPNCSAASLLMRITRQASGYFENMWLWVADHMIDDPDLESGKNAMIQTSIYSARGLLVESHNPVWLYGTSVEHNVFYQYNFHKAQAVFAGMIQTESPYYQPTPKPPQPFQDVVGLFPGDPSYKCDPVDKFNGCDESWGLIVEGSRDIFIAGAGIYSWFSTYSQDCIDTHSCQQVLVSLEKNMDNVRIQHLITIGANNSLIQDGKAISYADNLNVNSHPFWSQISVFNAASGGWDASPADWIDPKMWDMPNPVFTCAPPCTVRLPRWTKATSTVDYPLITVSTGTWTSTITVPPLTITDIEFNVVTIGDGGGKRQALEPFYPTPSPLSEWPRIVYEGPDGETSTASPTGPFPTPQPVAIGPGAPTPAGGGAWPTSPITPVQGSVVSPRIARCDDFSFNCFQPPWVLGEAPWDGLNRSPLGSKGYVPEDDDFPVPSEPPHETDDCYPMSTTTVDSYPSRPTIKHRYEGDAVKNYLTCSNAGKELDYVDAMQAIAVFCTQNVKDKLDEIDGPWSVRTFFPFKTKGRGVDLSFSIYADCDLPMHSPMAVAKKRSDGIVYGKDLCIRYFKGILDGCDCKGINHKRGGFMYNDCYSLALDVKSSKDSSD